MEDKILLINEDGQEVEFMIDDQFEFEEKTYLVLCENDDSEDALLFRLEEEDGEMVLKEVEDEDEFERVSEYYFES